MKFLNEHRKDLHERIPLENFLEEPAAKLFQEIPRDLFMMNFLEEHVGGTP